MDLLGRFGVYASQSLFRPIQASGGSETDEVIGGRLYRVHEFTSSDDFVVTDVGDEGEVEYLIVAGGGAGGDFYAGGGGAGGIVTGNAVMTQAIHTVTVGSGGAGGLNPAPVTPGGDSSVFSCNASGGGIGGTGDMDPAGNGGSGGGTREQARINVPGKSTQTNCGNSLGYGNDGATGSGGTGDTNAGGGGGAAGAGQVGTSTKAGDGGNGITFNMTGTATTYAGGGGGCADHRAVNTSSVGGVGGGGAGGNGNDAVSGVDGLGGGGGGATDGYISGDGGNGVVIIRYPLEAA